MDVSPGTGVTSETPPAQAALLRRAWFEVAASAAPQLTDLPALLDAQLTDLEDTARLDESSLLAVAENASQYALEQGAGEVARTLSKRLRRAIYEFLLALDAVNPAELSPPPPKAPAPPLPSAQGAPVALMPGDVSGGDDAPVAATVEAVEAPPVPLWEQVSAPAHAREVYRVASREVTPVADAAPTAEDAGPQAPEVGIEAEAAVPGTDPDAPVAEADRDIEAIIAEVFDGAAQDVEATPSTAEAVTLEAAPDEGAESTGAVLDAGVDGHPEAPTDDGSDLAVVTDEVAPEPVQSEAPNGEAETAPTDSAAALHEEEVELAAPQAEATPVITWSPVVDLPAPPAAEAGPSPSSAVPNGVKPPRELLRVPRQFRRLPPLPGRQRGESELIGEPAVTWTNVTPEIPAADLETPAVAETETEAETATPPVDAFTLEVEDEEAFGVPALPWPVEDEAAPAAENSVEAPAEAEAAAVEVELEPEEELGLPFAPLAELPAEPAEPVAHAEAEPAAQVPDVFALPEHAEEPDAEVVAEAFTEIAPTADPFAGFEDAAELAYPDLPPPAAPASPSAAQPTMPWTPVPIAPSAAPFPIAPREGFHLTDPLDMALGNGVEDEPLPTAPPEQENPFITAVPPVSVPPQVSIAPPASAPSAPAMPATPAAASDAAPHGEQDDAGQWRVRQSPRAQLLAERMAQKRREEAARAAFEAASVPEEHHRGRKKRRDESLPDLPTARRQLDEHLRRKRGAEAAALLQRLAQELGGREIADLSLDSGDRCRALGQGRSATNCYLAAWRADPLYETPLWRLSDICLNEQDIELAVGYLERIADLMRSRGDDEGAIGVYRKIAMIAPERQDVRDVIRLAKTTGRLDV